jgi:RNA polymerase sigma factor (sigma-70 family)
MIPHVVTPTKTAVDDAALVFQIGNGDLEALGILFDRHEDAVARFLNRMGVSPADIDDLVQNTFLQVIRAVKRFDPRVSVRSWLLGIASMMARRHRRSLGRLTKRIRSWATIPRGQGLTPDQALEERQAELRLTRALDALSAKKREAFVLVTLEGMSGEEAAVALGVPVNTIWTRLHHARRELREMVGAEP